VTETIRPESAKELQDYLKSGAAHRHSLLAVGNQSRIRRHSPSAHPTALLSMAEMASIHWIDAEDQTCEVDAGVSPAMLDTALHPLGLCLGVDAPHASSGTLGGLFMAPDMSLLHGAYGGTREQVLGATWLLADGTEIKTGGRVVKNVAGYDVTRLFLGSRGRLAICTRLSLRLRPLPRLEKWWTTTDPLALKAPCIRMAFSPQCDERAWVQTFAIQDAPHPSFTAVDPIIAKERKAMTLEHFATNPLRHAHVSPPCDWRQNAWELTAHQECLQAPSTAAGQGVPHRVENRWLNSIAAACCPNGERFLAVNRDGA